MSRDKFCIRGKLSKKKVSIYQPVEDICVENVFCHMKNPGSNGICGFGKNEA